MSKNVKELVGRLVSNLSPFTDKNAESLAAYDEETLKSLAETEEWQPVSEEPAVEPVAATPKEEDEPVSLSEEEQIQALPEALKSLVRKAQVQEGARREHLITSLSKAQDRLSEDDLTAKDTEALEDYAAILKLDEPEVDNSCRGLSVNREDDSTVESPPSLQERIIERRAAN